MPTAVFDSIQFLNPVKHNEAQLNSFKIIQIYHWQIILFKPSAFKSVEQAQISIMEFDHDLFSVVM